ncbi:hypothetical protein GN956_G15708 [Arapaima gigas]
MLLLPLLCRSEPVLLLTKGCTGSRRLRSEGAPALCTQLRQSEPGRHGRAADVLAPFPYPLQVALVFC